MYTSYEESCARRFGRAAMLAWACCALSCATNSVAHATFLHPSHEPSVDIRVVDKAGPIWVSDSFVREDQFGLPSLRIYETFKDYGQVGPLWADVEVKVSVRHGSSHSGFPFDIPFWPDWGWVSNGSDGASSASLWGGSDSGGSGWGWGGWDDWGWGHDDPPADPNFSPQSLVAGIDKFVKNGTSSHWNNFRIGLGTGIGDNYVPSGPGDGLYVVTDPEPKEVTSFYGDLFPSQGPESSSELEIDELEWFADGSNNPGQAPWDKSTFWFGVHIPDHMFYQDSYDPDVWHAKFTIRQHTDNGIPEPATGVTLLMGSLAVLLRRRE